ARACGSSRSVAATKVQMLRIWRYNGVIMELLWRSSVMIVALASSGLGAAAQTETETFSLHKVLDTNGTGHVALTYLLPKGWTTDDHLGWNLSRRTAPMQ